MEIRSLRLPDDLDGLSRLTVAARSSTVLEVVTTDSGFQLTETPVPAPLMKDQDFLGEVTAADRHWTEGYVAVDGQSIVGFAATAYERWNRRQILCHLYVDAGCRGRGVGRALVEHAMARGRANGARHLWLETQNTNVPAVRAYQAMGFELVGLDRTLYDGEAAHETALYLARPLEPPARDL